MMQALLDYPFPSSTEIEQQIIADLVAAPDILPEAQRIISANLFSDTDCRNAWFVLCQMQDKHESIDLVSFSSRIEKEFLTQAILPNMHRETGTGLATMEHCRILQRLSIQKYTYQFAVKMLQEASKNNPSMDELVSLPERLAGQIRSDLKADTDSVRVSEVLDNLAESLEQTQQDKLAGKATRVPTGFPTLDWMTFGGFNAGNLIVLAARPSVGKTAVMLQMAMAAASAGIPATIFSLEMTNQELGQRLLLSTGIVKPLELASGEIHWEDFERAAGNFAQRPLFLNDSAKSIDEIATRIILNHQHGKCGIAFVDYLGLIDTAKESRMPLYQIIAGITKRLKQVAKECKIPIVLLSQLNRASASENRPPALYDLRDSGSIEQDADIVLMLEREAGMEMAADTDATRLNMWIRKNRQGKAGEFHIVLQPNQTFTCFSELDVRG